MNQQHIHCIINNCHYWSNGNKCAANEILVATDQFGQKQPDKVDASMASQLTPSGVSNCWDTCCKSYVPKNSDKTTVDGITRMS